MTAESHQGREGSHAVFALNPLARTCCRIDLSVDAFRAAALASRGAALLSVPLAFDFFALLAQLIG